MPRIPDDIIDSVFFLYPTREEAIAGKNPGGSGFVVSIGKNVTTGAGTYFYGVTNWHVACRDGYSVIRMNTTDGGVDVFEFGPEDWEFSPGGPDVAVVPLELDHRVHKACGVSIRHFAPKLQLSYNTHENISVGDDTFMLGLFVDHTGVTTNVPSARSKMSACSLAIRHQ